MPDFDFYRSTYHGSSIPGEAWPEYGARGAEQLERYRRSCTLSAPGPDSEALAVCALADALYGFDLLASGGAGPVQSVSIGSVSASFGGSGAQGLDISPKGQARELYRRAALYLDIYRGAGG